MEVVKQKGCSVFQKRQNIAVFGDFARTCVVVYCGHGVVLNHHFNLICVRAGRGFAPFGIIHNNSVQIVVFVDVLNLRSLAVGRGHGHICVNVVEKHMFVVGFHKNRVGCACLCVGRELFTVFYLNADGASFALFGARPREKVAVYRNVCIGFLGKRFNVCKLAYVVFVLQKFRVDVVFRQVGACNVDVQPAVFGQRADM